MKRKTARTPGRFLNRWHQLGRYRWYLHGRPFLAIWRPRPRPGASWDAWFGPLFVVRRPYNRAALPDNTEGHG